MKKQNNPKDQKTVGRKDRKHVATKVLLNENMLTGKVVHKSDYNPLIIS